nr:recombinase family protein [Mesorhizobium sp.]
MESIRQVHLWMRHEGIMLSAVNYTRAAERLIVWKLPVYKTVHHILTNPIYAGAYAFGRTGSKVTIEARRKRILRGIRRDRTEREVLLTDHHEGYLSRHDFETNQRLITDKATSKGTTPRGALRWGELLMGDLLRCGHCGRKAARLLFRQQRQYGALSLPRSPAQPWNRSVYRLRIVACRSSDQRGESSTSTTAQYPSGDQSHRDFRCVGWGGSGGAWNSR